MKYLLTSWIIVLMAMNSCKNKSDDFSVTGYKPIYIDTSKAFEIKFLNATNLNNVSKSVLSGDFLYVLEPQIGIHVINQKEKTNPVNYKFIQVYGCNDFTINGNNLFVNNFQNLIIINIRNVDNMKVLSRKANVIKGKTIENPPQSGYFECVDDSKGLIIGWEIAELNNPECSY